MRAYDSEQFCKAMAKEVKLHMDMNHSQLSGEEDGLTARA
jgi:hypothetical protein